MRSKQPKPRWRRALNFLLLLGSSYLLMCFGLAKLYVSPIRSDPPTVRSFSRVVLPSGEPIWVSSGLLDGHPNGKVLYIMSHGLGGDIGHWSQLAKPLVEKGYDVILTEMSAHGDSPDRYCGFGTTESDMIVEATRWADEKYAVRPHTILVGVSLGGAASWLAAEKAPHIFDAIVSEGAFTHLNEVSDNFFDRRMRGGRIIFWPVKFFASKISGVDPGSVNPIEAAKNWRKPTLVIQCGEDDLMKPAYAEEFAKASGGELWTIPKASHANGCVVASQEYFKRLVGMANLLTGAKARTKKS